MFGPVSNFYEHNQNETVSLEKLNEELWVLNIPAVIFVLFCMILGFFGNILVVYIYRKKFRRSNHRYFILCLALLDLIGCLIGGSYMTYSLRMPYMMTSSAICKISRYFHYLVNHGSAILLLVIAVERFIKICRPFQRQFSHRQTFLLCIFSIGFSTVASIPAAVLYGDSTIKTGVKNISGTTCFITDEYHNSTFSKLFIIYLFVETVAITIVMGVLYTFIIRELWAKKNLALSDAMLSVRVRENAEIDVAYTNSYSLEYFDENNKNIDCNKRIDEAGKQTYTKDKDNDLYQKSVAKISHNEEPFPSKCSKTMPHATSAMEIASLGLVSQSSINDVGNGTDIKTVNDLPKINPSSKATKHRRPFYESIIFCSSKKLRRDDNSSKFEVSKRITREKQRKRSMEAVRVTLMLFLITLVFCLSFYPHLVLILLVANYDTFVEKLTAQEMTVFQLFLRIFIINNTVNPIIYGFCDAKFRAECRNLFSRTFRC
ncbi:hypothetical protein CHS0354_040464 [Potamilus streckersoni]|uniref:G-protein coupled receptors family 1 profile domain-containing protein n=1 Tax=Potamilus streckersoni TaxID=2493646 RepID=A0AAE0T065_9BIVA|nr:hypothetical protein CHS0354_040464 [Potamilus streckersoni]